MKIVSQLLNAVQGATNKSAPVDISKGNFQSTFADAMGTTMATAGKVVNSKQEDAETKKTATSDNKKKSSSSSDAEPTVAPQVPIDRTQLLPVTSAVPLNTLPPAAASVNSGTMVAQFSTPLAPEVSVSTSGTNDNPDPAHGANPPAAQAVAARMDGTAGPSTPSTKVLSVKNAEVPEALTQLTTLPAIIPASEPTASNKVPDAAAGNTSGLIGSGSQPASSFTSRSSADGAAQPDAAMKPESVVSVAPEPLSEVASLTAGVQSQPIARVGSQSTASVTPKPVSKVPSQPTTAVTSQPVVAVPQQTAANVVSVPTAGIAPLHAPGVASQPVAKVSSQPFVAVVSQTRATPSAESGDQSSSTITDTASSPSPVADLRRLSQVAPQTVPQQALVQDPNELSAASNQVNFKVPAGRVETVASTGANLSAGAAKGKSTVNRAFSTTGTTDDKQSSDGTDGEFIKARVGTPEVIGKDVSSGTGDTAQGTALAQSTHAAQVAPASSSADALSAAPQSVSNASAPPAPAQPSSTEHVPVEHAMSSAQFIQSAHGSEMKLGMQSAEFGNISISTSLNHQALSAQISIDHSALGHALAAHLPAIEEKLGSAYGVQAKVELREAGTNSSSNDSARESKESSQPRGGNQDNSASTASTWSGGSIPSTITSSTLPVATSSRLDIRI